MVPYDVLVDPLSLPSHPVIQERENVLDILYGEPRGSSAINDSDREQVMTVKQPCHASVIIWTKVKVTMVTTIFRDHVCHNW